MVEINTKTFTFYVMTEKIKILKTIHIAICAGMILAYLFAGNFTIEQLIVKMQISFKLSTFLKD